MRRCASWRVWVGRYTEPAVVVAELDQDMTAIVWLDPALKLEAVA